MHELAQELLAGEEAWIVGGAVRDRLLGRELVDLDIACREPKRAARAYARSSGGAPFPLSERHGAWRVALEDGRTVDFTPLPDGIETDLASRDFTINALASPLHGGEPVDPFGGSADLEAGVLRAVSETIFEDDPLRLLRAVRLEDELGFRLDPETERLVRANAHLVTAPAGERILVELRRFSPDGFLRLDELGLLAPLGGTLGRQKRLDACDHPDYPLVVVFGENLRRLPVSNETRRFARTLHHIARPELAVAELARATRPGGHVFVVDQIAPVDPLVALELNRFERTRDPSHTRTLADNDLRHLFEANGLMLERSEFGRERRELDAYLDLAGCEGEQREQAKALAPPECTAEVGWYLFVKPAI